MRRDRDNRTFLLQYGRMFYVKMVPEQSQALFQHVHDAA